MTVTNFPDPQGLAKSRAIVRNSADFEVEDVILACDMLRVHGNAADFAMAQEPLHAAFDMLKFRRANPELYSGGPTGAVARLQGLAIAASLFSLLTATGALQAWPSFFLVGLVSAALLVPRKKQPAA